MDESTCTDNFHVRFPWDFHQQPWLPSAMGNLMACSANPLYYSRKYLEMWQNWLPKGSWEPGARTTPDFGCSKDIEQSLKEYETKSTCEHNPEQNWARNDISVMRSYTQLVFLMLFLLPFLAFYFSPVPFELPSSSWVQEAEKESSHTVAQDFLGKPFHLWHSLLNI